MIHIKKIDFNTFIKLSPRLNQLLNNSSQNNIFLTPMWLTTWLEASELVDQSYFLIAEEEQEIIGFAPLMLQLKNWPLGKVTILSFINSSDISADHIEFVCLKNKEQAVNKAIFNYLLNHKQDWDILSLEDLPQHSPTHLLAIDSFENKYQLHKTSGEHCPYIILNGTWDDFLAQKSKNFRQQTRSKRRKFETKLKGTYKTCKNQQQVQRVLQKLAKFNPQRWNKKGKKSSFSDHHFLDFHLQISYKFLEKNYLDLSYLEVDGEIIAVIYNYIYANKVYYYNTAFDPQYNAYSIGRVLMGYSIEQALQQHKVEFDFLRGIHSYKDAWTNLKRKNINLLITKRNFNSQSYNLFQKIKASLISWVKSNVPKSIQLKIRQFLLK
ncbi:MAG: GNAT family N-acetyltransferase [Pseudomonadota bacterium]